MESELRGTWIFGTLTAVSAVDVGALSRIPQAQDYHETHTLPTAYRCVPQRLPGSDRINGRDDAYQRVNVTWVTPLGDEVASTL